MVFKFDSASDEALTEDNNEAPQRIYVPPGIYSPSCTVKGSNPLAEVKIMNGNFKMPGKRIVGVAGLSSTQYVAEAAEFKG